MKEDENNNHKRNDLGFVSFQMKTTIKNVLTFNLWLLHEIDNSKKQGPRV
jgi:hypothetical protein